MSSLQTLKDKLPQTQRVSVESLLNPKAPSEAQKFRPSAPASHNSYADQGYINAGEVNQHGQQPRAMSTYNQEPPVRKDSSTDNILLSKEMTTAKKPQMVSQIILSIVKSFLTRSRQRIPDAVGARQRRRISGGRFRADAEGAS
jgi:hypothetical protein